MPQDPLPNDLNVASGIMEYFDSSAKMINHEKKGAENIAMIKDIECGREVVSVVIYHDSGYVICLYHQKLDSMFAAMVVFKKLRTALVTGQLEKAWHELTTKSQRKL